MRDGRSPRVTDTKTCTKCGETKPLSEFSKAATGSFGVRGDCRKCRRADSVARHKASERGMSAESRRTAAKQLAVAAVRTCVACEEEKPYDQFFFRNGKPGARCKSCISESGAEYRSRPGVREIRAEASRKWHQDNSEVVAMRRREYYTENREEINAQSRAYHAANPDTVKAAAKRWREENRDHIAEKAREAYASTPSLRVRQSVSTSVRRALSGDKESKRTFEILGYTLKELMDHLEAKFQPGMSWENYEYRGWHIDHKRPQSSFRFTSIDDPDFKACWSLSNLQPMWWLDNISKGAKWSPQTPSNDNMSEAVGRAG